LLNFALIYFYLLYYIKLYLLLIPCQDLFYFRGVKGNSWYANKDFYRTFKVKKSVKADAEKVKVILGEAK